MTAPPRESRFRRVATQLRRPSIAFGGVVVFLWLIVVLTVQWWAPYDPYETVAKRLLSPNSSHWFGTDEIGRDLFTRVMFGARESIPLAIAVVAAAVIIGSLMGAVAGYFGRLVDAVIMRTADVLMSFPALLLAMVVSVALGPGPTNAGVAVVIVWWPFYARLARGQVLSIKNREHVEAAISIGAGTPRIIRKHILPMAMTPILVNVTSDIGQVILVMASLSFLGLGTAPPVPEWGAMITSGSKFFFQWWVAGTPGIAILTVVLACNFIGDGVRDILDRRSAQR